MFGSPIHGTRGVSPRARKARYALLVVVLCLPFILLSVGGASAANPVSFSAGTLIIPMDTDTAANHASYNQNNGMWKAYGLVYKLLQNGIPVQWAIAATKASTADIDVTVSSVKDKRTGTSLGSWDYRGAPFMVDSAYAAQALPIIQAWWAANGNLPNVHEAQAGFTANISTVLSHAPRIANEYVNIGVTSAYYNAAGIPDANGNPWSATSPNVLNETQIANGGLFDQGVSCTQPKYDIFVTPHNSGYSYSLTDPTNLGTKAYSQLDTFVAEGGGWTALCHSILSNENAIAALTTNGSSSVKALFQTSQPGGVPGGFLTTNGFSTIDNTGGTWNVLAPGLPVAQGVPTSATNVLPGGSVQTWPAPGNTGAPTYYANTSRVATFTGSGVSHDNIITGIYHNGSGAGRLTYIGGHSFATTGTYSANPEAPYLRAFYNSLLMNGAGTAKLDVVPNPATYPQNGTGLLSVSIKNIGATTARGLTNAGITLAPGITYVATTAGPTPTVNGQLLTWGSGLGDVAGGATAVTFTVSVAGSVSSTTGSKHLGTFSANFTDDFGGSFTAGVCKDITISPTPVPTLTKTPSSQGPINPGSPVTWTLTYGNAGGTALSSSTVQDTLPTGFAYVSSTSTPSLGAPTIIPGTRQIVRWNAGTVAATTPSAGTITITARAGPVTLGTGSPPTQTFTNNALLSGSASGVSYSTSASATVDDQALDIDLSKTVDHQFLTSLPGTALYTMAPRSEDNSPLSNVRVFDPLPSGIVASPTVGQGGTYGAYSPSAASPGPDGGDGLTTSMSVSTNLVASGTAVTVTLNVKATSAVSTVFGNPMTATGGPYTCSAPSPASQNVPAGGAGVNFTYSCTTDDLGEYVFSADADDNGTNSWPVASSSSVLSVASGGPNVALWNLGSNTSAVPGQTVTSGYTDGIYGLRGATTTTFYKYDTSQSSWGTKAVTTATVGAGGALATDGAGTIYALGGNNTQSLWAYSAAGNSWTAKANTGTNVNTGAGLVFLNVGGTKYLFATMGNNTKTFKRYDISANTWAAKTNAPASVKGGGSLSTDGTNIFLVNGNNTKTFYRYNVASDTWTTLTSMATAPNTGGASVYLGGYVYVLRGNRTNTFSRYSISGATWATRANAPAAVNAGGALTTDGTYIYAYQGGTTAFWRYDPTANTWSTLSSTAAATGAGAALVYMPGVAPQGRFSSFDVTRSLVGTGDTFDITLSLTSSTSLSSIGSGTLTTTPTGGASCSSLTGPTLTSSDTTSSSTNDPVTYKWTCTVAGTTPGSLTFGDSTVTGAGGVAFPAATSMSVLTSPPLTMQVTVPNGAPNPVADTSLLVTDQGTAGSPTVSTWSGSPTFSVVKTSSVDSATTLYPDDRVTYTMAVQNTGTGNANAVVVHDTVPAQASYVSCSGGSSCSNSGGTVTWNLGAMAPGDSGTVTMTVSMREDLAVSDTGYTVSNAATVTSTEVTTPVSSNTVTNHLEVRPHVVKSVDAWNAGNGDPLTYTVQIDNPGAAFTATVTDPIPAHASFAGLGTCAPACTFPGSTVTWSGATIQPGLNTFTFGATVSGSGGDTVSNVATVDPTSPDLASIASNQVDTEVGPTLELVKLSDRTGLVGKDDTITYSLVATNESRVAATNATVADPLPPNTTYVASSCTTSAGTCSYSGGQVNWDLGTIAGNGSVFLTFRVTVGTGSIQVTNAATIQSTNSPDPVPSNPVDNGIATYPLTAAVASGQGTITSDTGGISCADNGGTCSATYGSGTLVRLTATGRNGQQFTGWSGDCSGTSPSCQVTMSQARNVQASFATPPSAPDLVVVKAHTGSFAQGGTGSYTLTVSNIGGTTTSGTVTVVDTPPTGLTVTALSGTGWTCDVPTSTCTRSTALASGGSYPDITVGVSVAADAAASLTNHATVSGGGESNTSNDTADDATDVTATPVWPLAVHISGQGTVTSDVGSVSCSDLGGTCSATYDAGSLVTLTAAGRNGQQFTGWTGDCTGSSPSCQVTMSQARDVTATFAVPPADPDLVIVKSHVGSFQQAGTGTYTLTASNIGGLPTSGTATVVDTPPSGLTITGLSGTGWTCDVPTKTCTRSDALAAGGTYPTVSVTVSVDRNAAASVTNHAAVSGGGELNTGNDTADDATTITPFPTWQLTTSVNGSGTGSIASDVGSINCSSGGGTCSDTYDDGTLVTLTAAPGANSHFTGWGSFCSGTATTCQVPMSAAHSVTATFVLFAPDLTISKSHAGDFSQGEVGTYAVSVSNVGADPSYGLITVVDNPPAGLTVTDLNGPGWSCDVGTLTCTRSDSVAAGASFPDISVTADVAGNASSPVTNTATVAGGGDVDSSNNSASDEANVIAQQFPLNVSVIGEGQVDDNTGGIVACSPSAGTCDAGYDNGTVVTLTATPGPTSTFGGWGGACSASGTAPTCQVTMDQAKTVSALFPAFQSDLTIAKTHTGSFTQGGTGTYTLSVSNLGPDPSFGDVTVADNPPPGLTVTDMSGAGWTCDVPTATCTRPDGLPVGNSFQDVTVTVAVDGNAPASLTNDATVSGGGDTDPSNNDASDPTTIDPQQFPLNVTVNGTGAGTVDADSGAVSGCTGSGGTCSGSYDNGTLVTLTATTGAHSHFTGWGGACSGTATTCQVTMDQARTVTATFSAFQSDPTVVKSHTGSFTQGGTGSYTLHVSNVGSDPTFGSVAVADNPPAALTVTGMSGSGWSCDVPTAICSRSDDLAAGASYPDITVDVSVDGNAPASVTNHATVSGGGDGNLANNTSDDPTTVAKQTFPLNVAVAAGAGSVDADTGLIACTDAGGLCADSYDNGTLVTLTETPAAHYDFTGWGGACSGTATTCQVTMSQARTVTAAFQAVQPDLTIAKTHSGNFVQGATGSYTVTVSNTGPDPSFGTVTVVDNPPAALTITGMSGGGWTCDVPTATCTRSSSLAGGGAFPDITVDVSVDGNAGSSVTNSADVSGGGDVNPADNHADDSTTIDKQQFPLTVGVGGSGSGSVDADSGAVSGCTSSGGTCSDGYDNGTLVTLTESPDAHSNFAGWGGACSGTATTCQVTMDQARTVTATFVVFQADPTVVKSHTGSFTQAGTGSYTLHVTNLGADPTYGSVSVADNAPAALTVTGMSGSGWSCDVPTATCSRSDDLAAGASYPDITVDVSVDGNAPTSVTNHATVSGGGDVDLTNNTSDDPTTIVKQQFPLTVAVTAGQGAVDADLGAVHCTDTGGPCSDEYDNGTDVTLTATPALHFNFTGWGGACTGTAATCQVTMSQARSVTASFAPFQPDLTITKSHTGAFAQAGAGSYTLSVSNVGPDPSFGAVSVTDTAPAALTITGMSGSGWSCDVPTATCTRSDALGAGASYPAITVDVSVDGNAPASVTNAADVSGGGDVNHTNDHAGDPTTIDPQQFPLTVSIDQGHGLVAADVGSIACTDTGGVCAQSYDNGTIVQLTATGHNGQQFTGWSGDCSGSSPSCQVTMSQARTVGASFASPPGPPDLAVVKSHTDTFRQGGTASYTLTVSNIGGTSTTAPATVVDTPPAGLTITAMSGPGWTCDVPTATCSRADVLGAGSSYNDITVAVAIARNAAASVTNHADVSGGGETDTTNDGADDLTTIVQVPTWPLTVAVGGTGQGSVSADVGAVQGCTASGGTCSGTYDDQTVVTLTTTPGATSTFSGWAGACTGTAATCQVTMSQARNVTATFTVFQPDMKIVKSHSGSFTQGGTGSYTLTASNVGTDPSYGAIAVVDTAPAGLTITDMSGGGWSCDVPTATCTRSDALPAGFAFPGITVSVAVGGNAAASVTNTADVSGGGDVDLTNNHASDPTTIQPQRFPLTVTVDGTGSGSVDADSGAVSGCTSSGGTCAGSYDNGTAVTLTAAAAAGSSFTGWTGACSGAALTCQVTMSQARSVTATFRLLQPDLTIAKSHTGTWTQGGTGSYTISVSNTGTDPSFGPVSVADNAPADLVINGMGGSGWACDVLTATCSRSDALAAGGSYPNITVNVSVSGTAAPSVVNDATVSGGGDVNPANNNASDPTAIAPQQFPLTVGVGGTGSGSVDASAGAISGCTSSAGTCADDYDNGTAVTLTATPDAGSGFAGWGGACSGTAPTCQVTMDQARNVMATFALVVPNLTIAKSHTGNFTQGGTGSYAVTVSNVGTDPSFGPVTVAESAPADLTITGMSGPGWSCDVPNATCDRSDALAAGAAYPVITVDVSVSADASPSQENDVAVFGGGDADLSNNSAADPTTIDPQQFPLTVTVDGTGSGSVGADSGAVSGCTSAGGTCAGSYDNGTLVTLTASPAAGSQFTAWTGACSGAALTCQVTMSQARNVTATFTGLLPDLTVAKSHTGTWTQGGTGSYTLTVSNAGADAAYGTVSVADNAPADLTVTGMSGSGWNCDVPTATCTRSDALAIGASYPDITVAVSVSGNAPASVVNHATVSGGGDVNPANNNASDPATVDPQQFPLTVTVTGSGSGTVGADLGAVSGCTTSGGVCSDTYDNGTLVTLTATAAAGSSFTGWTGACSGTATTCQVTMSQARNVTATFVDTHADLTIAKSHSGTFTQGQSAAYRLDVSNVGSGATVGTVTVVDTPPASLSVTAMSGTGWTCDVPTATCTRSDALAAGGVYPKIKVKALVAANAPASVTNHASVAGGGDADLTNNDASDPATVGPQQFPLTVTVTGNGSVSADKGAVSHCTGTSGVCTDRYDAGTLVTLTANPGTGTTFQGWSGACSGTALTCQVTMDQARNAVAVFTDPRPDLTIAKTHSGTFTQGAAGSYSITVTNVGGGGTTAGVNVTDQPPTGLTVTGMSGTGWACDVPTKTCTRSDSLGLSAGYSPITVSVAIAADAPASVVNVATVSGGGDINASNNSASDPTTIVPLRFPLTVTVDGSGSGSVGADTGAVVGCTSSGGVCTDTYDSGTVVTLTATAGTNSTFAGWGGACSGTATTCQVTMSQARNVTATFNKGPITTPIEHPGGAQSYPLTVVLRGTGHGGVGSAPNGIACGADCNQVYTSGTLVTLTAVPAPGSVFTGFTGCISVNGNHCVVRMDRARHVIASFELRRVKITGKVSSRVVRPGRTITNRLLVRGLGDSKAVLVMRLYGPFATRAGIRCVGRPVSTTRLVVGNGITRTPAVTIPAAGLYALQETVAGEKSACAERGQNVLGAPLIITGQGDRAHFVPAGSTGGSDTPTRVTIASAGIDAATTPIGIDLSSGALGTPTDIRRTGWWTDGSRDGAGSGVTLIAGHVDSAAQGAGALFNLRRTQVGDRVVVRSRSGRSVAYRVISVRLYPKRTLPLRVWAPAGSPRLVLVTCGGPFDPALGHYRDNVVVTAVPA